MIERIKNKVFNKIHRENLVYNTCWEDPRCDRALLGLDAQSRVVMLTSAGCNALDYLLDDPMSIDCVDMNPRQNALLDFKSALILQTDHPTLFRFFGQGRYEDAEDVFHEMLRAHLDDFPREYWQRNLYYFNGKGLRKSFYWYGSAGAAAFLLKTVLETSPETKQLIHQLFECEDLERQQQLYNRLEPRLINFFTRWLFNRHLFQSMLGVPQNQQNLAKQAFHDGMAGYIKQCFRKVFTARSLRDNYFWKLYFFGSYSPDCCPNYLQKAHFGALQQRVGRLRTHTQTLSQFLHRNPGRYTHFILLDHQDWLAAHNRPALHEEWRLILQNSAPNAKILLRSAAAAVDFIPDFVYRNVQFNMSKTAEAHRDDRVGTYASVLLAEVN